MISMYMMAYTNDANLAEKPIPVIESIKVWLREIPHQISP